MGKREVKNRRLDLLPCFLRLKHMSELCVFRHCNRQWGGRAPCEANPTYMVKGTKCNGEITYKYSTKVYSVSMLTMHEKLLAITKEDAELMGFTNGNHPVDMILQVIPVLPNNCKAPFYDGAYLRHSHIANQYKELVKLVGSNCHNKVYQTLCSMICKSPSNAIDSSDQATAMDQLQGKGAVVRGNSLGKTGNQHMRSVSGPDSAMRFGKVRFPRENIMLATKLMVVTPRNLDVALHLCKHNMILHYVTHGSSIRRAVHPDYRPSIGDTVHRKLCNKDIDILNRQPTLHKGSVLAVEVVIGYQLTVGLHMTYTIALNADFDGDENNIFNLHCLQAEADARILQAPKYNFISVSGQAPMYGLIINGVTAAYLMSKYNDSVSVSTMDMLVSLLDVAREYRWGKLKLKMRRMGLNPYTTRGVLSVMYPEDFYYDRRGVQIVEGVHVTGTLNRSLVGNKSNSLHHEIYLKYGPDRAALFLTESTG